MASILALRTERVKDMSIYKEATSKKHFLVKLRGTPPLKTYLPNQITMKLSTYFKSRVPRWDLFFSKKFFKIARFSAFTGQKVLMSALFSVTHYAKTAEAMTSKFWHKIDTMNTEGLIRWNFDTFSRFWNINFFDRFLKNAEILEKSCAQKWP